MSVNNQCSVDVTASEKLLNSNTDNNGICIEFTDLTYEVTQSKGKKKVILNSISGYFRPGRLSVILGPSGAGKTSLLNIIAGQKLSASFNNSITVNGVERDVKSFRKQACYVPQELALMPLLTVAETLYIAACFKLGKLHDEASRRNIVCDTAKKLGLSECLETLAQNLSGGEKKRLSIGVEVISSPAVMLLDEPTSGLDSTAASQVIDLLHSISRTGCTVICAIHQPSSQMISQFDDVIVICQGECYYCGPQEELYNTFSVAGYECPRFYNMSEFVLEVITGRRVGDLEKLRAKNYVQYVARKSTGISEVNLVNGIKSEATSQLLNPDANNRIVGSSSVKNNNASSWRQVKTLFHRAFICIKRDNVLTKLRLTAHIIVAFLLGAVFHNFGQDAAKTQSNIACIFFFIIFLFFANAMPAVQTFPTEASVLLRENLNNWYKLWTYYFTKVLSDFPMQILCSSSFLLIAYPLTGQPIEGMRCFQMWCVCTLITILAQSFGIATGAAFNTELGIFLIPALNIPMLLFAGFFLKLGEVPVYLRMFSAISYFRYAFEGALQAIYGFDRHLIPCSIEFCYLRSPKRILSELDMPSVTFDVIITVLLVWIVSLHITIYAILRWKIYNAVK